MTQGHIWEFEDWKDIPLSEIREKFILRSMWSPRFCDLTVSDLCSLSMWKRTSPVGIYVFSKESSIVYVGKTHGRSLHERAISHIDNREPKEGSPHLAQFVSSLVKRKECSSREEAVCHILHMKMTWLPVPNLGKTHEDHKRSIAIIERRLLWRGALNPAMNSDRVKKNNWFTVKGQKHLISENTLAGKSG